MEKIIPTLQALEEEARDLVSGLSPRNSGATLVTLSGELGAGKTSFTQAIARELGVSGLVSSPTFVLEKIYELPETSGRGFARLVHIDAYRLDGAAALAPLGFDELMRDAKNLVVLEWPERVADALPTPTRALTLGVRPDNARSLTYAG